MTKFNRTKHMQRISSLGGKAKNKKMNAKQRSDNGRKVVEARWSKKHEDTTVQKVSE